MNDLINLVKDWPKLNMFNIVTLGLGISGLLFNLFRIRKTSQVAEDRLQFALEDFKRRILNHIIDFKFINASYINTLALAIEKEFSCAVITDKIKIEVIRSVVLEIDILYKGAALEKRLKILNEVVHDIDTNIPPLLSLAYTDRIDAYRRSQPIVLFFIFILLVIIVRLYSVVKLPFVSIIFLVLIIILLLFEYMLILSSIRAYNFWNKNIKNKDSSSLIKNIFYPNAPHIIFDFFLFATVSNTKWAYKFWNLYWAPLWEFFYFFNLKFLRMHDYRYSKAKKIQNNLESILRELDILKINGKNPDTHILQEIDKLSKQLWVVTGNDQFYNKLKEEIEAYRI